MRGVLPPLGICIKGFINSAMITGGWHNYLRAAAAKTDKGDPVFLFIGLLQELPGNCFRKTHLALKAHGGRSVKREYAQAFALGFPDFFHEMGGLNGK